MSIDKKIDETEIPETEFMLQYSATLSALQSDVGKMVQTMMMLNYLQESGEYKMKYYLSKEGHLSYQYDRKKPMGFST